MRDRIVSFSFVILLITALSAGAVPVIAAAQFDTIQYRCNAAHTGDYSPVAGPVPSNGQLKWNYTTGGAAARLAVFSSPAVANGVVYVGSDDNNTYALNATTGAKVWSFKTGGVVFSSPAVSNGIVYVGSIDHNVYALNAQTGSKLWNFATGGNVSSSPAVANRVVYVGSDNLYALYANNGTKLWNYTTRAPVGSSPAVANGVVYVGSFDHNVYALNATTGAKVWSFTTGGYVLSSTAVSNGIVYVGSNSNNVYAIGNAATVTSQGTTPGFEVVLAFVGLVIAAYIVKRKG